MGWTILNIEAYCSRNWEYYRKHSKYCYEVVSMNPVKTKKVANPDYDKSVKKGVKPFYCKDKVCIDCIKCDHFTFCDVEDDLKKKLRKTIHKHYKL